MQLSEQMGWELRSRSTLGVTLWETLFERVGNCSLGKLFSSANSIHVISILRIYPNTSISYLCVYGN